MNGVFAQKPLAERMRPTTLAQYVGQEHLIGEGSILRRMLAQGQLQSMILWGPPGIGKTTLAQIIAHTVDLTFFNLSAIDAGVKEVRQVIDLAKKAGKAVLFIDEIHRFNKSQQDSLLSAVEKGYIVLIGATTENPSFEVNAALLSRCQVYILKPFEIEDLKQIVNQVIEKDEFLSQLKIEVQEWDALLHYSGGDGRKILNLLESLINNSDMHQPILINNKLVEKVLHQRTNMYDKKGEMHYDVISAFIKSIRGSDPNAAVYYLARMIDGGEDPKFIARRLLILASEDVGNANPNALLLATSCFQAVSMIGYPECRIILSQCVTYLASSPKSNAAYVAINQAQAVVSKTGQLQVPMHLRNAPTKLMKEIGYGDGYKYSHDYPYHFVDQEFMPDALYGVKLYEPQDNPNEEKQRKYLKYCWKEKYGY